MGMNMGIRVALIHDTRYTYARPVSVGPQVVRLRPAPHVRTLLQSYSLRVEPERHFLNWVRDAHGNFVARVVIPDPTPLFRLSVEVIADLQAFNPFDFSLEPSADQFPFEYTPELRAELAPYLVKAPLTPGLARLVEGLDRTPDSDVAVLVRTNKRVFEAIRYVIRLEPGFQEPEQTLEIGSGSCRDSA